MIETNNPSIDAQSAIVVKSLTVNTPQPTGRGSYIPGYSTACEGA